MTTNGIPTDDQRYTNRRPMVYQPTTNGIPTDDQRYTNRQPTVYQPTTNGIPNDSQSDTKEKPHGKRCAKLAEYYKLVNNCPAVNK